jgi:serine/threonine-protein kinase HipA
LSVWVEPEELFEGLRADCQRLRALPDLLSEIGLPQKTFNHPRIMLARLDATLKQWGLL